MIKVFFNDLNKIIGKKLLIFCYFILLLSSIVALLEVVSIGSVAMFIGIIIEPEKFLRDFLNISSLNFILELDLKQRVIYGSLVLIILFISKNLLTFYSNYLNSKLGHDIKNHISKKMFKSYINRNYYFHLNNNPSKLWHNITSEINLVCNYVILISQLFSSIILILGLIFLIIVSSNFSFFIIFIIFGLIVLLIYNYFKKQIKIKSNKRLFFETNISKLINHALGSIKETKIFNNENWFIKNFNDLVYKSENQKFYLNIINSLPRIILEIFSIGILLLIFIFLVFQNKSITEILPFLTLITLSIIRLVPVFTNVTIHINSLKFLDVSKKIVLDELKFFDKNIKRLESKNKQKNVPFKIGNFKELKLKKINFYYSSKKKIIKNLNLNINQKDKILFVGPSGSGKSTIINLILGLIKPQSGNIEINGKKLDNAVKQWHEKIGYIPQDVYLLDDTIKKNITYISDKFDTKLLANAIKLSKLDKELKKFPNGLNTKIGHRGKKLSGGQKQRLALARALYRNPEILIMDEPTSSLDEDSELKILNEFLDASKKLTVIMVAHRAKKFEKKFNKVLRLTN